MIADCYVQVAWLTTNVAYGLSGSKEHDAYTHAESAQVQETYNFVSTTCYHFHDEAMQLAD